MANVCMKHVYKVIYDLSMYPLTFDGLYMPNKGHRTFKGLYLINGASYEICMKYI